MKIEILIGAEKFPAELISLGQEKKMQAGTGSIFPVGTHKFVRLRITDEAYREISIAIKQYKEKLDAGNQ